MTNLEVKRLQHDAFPFENLFLGISFLGHEDELFDGGCKDFLILGSDEHRCDTHELELDQRDNSFCEEAVDNVDSDPERLRKHVVTQVDLQQPVDKGLAHWPSDFGLAGYVLGVGHAVLLW